MSVEIRQPYHEAANIEIRRPLQRGRQRRHVRRPPTPRAPPSKGSLPRPPVLTCPFSVCQVREQFLILSLNLKDDRRVIQISEFRIDRPGFPWNTTGYILTWLQLIMEVDLSSIFFAAFHKMEMLMPQAMLWIMNDKGIKDNYLTLKDGGTCSLY